MKWQHCPKMYSLLLSMFVIIDILLGATVDEAILDQLLQADAPINTNTTLSEEQASLSITFTPSAEQPFIKSIALTATTGKQEFVFPFQSTGKSLTTAVGLGIGNKLNRFLQSTAMVKSTAPDSSEKSSTLSIHVPNIVMSNLVSAEPTEMVLSNHSDKGTVNMGAKPSDLASTKPFLPVLSTIEISNEELAWRTEMTTPLFKFSTQPMLSSKGTPVHDTTDTLQNSSALARTRFLDEVESHPMSSESAESSTFKLTSVEQIIKTRQESTGTTAASTLHTFSAEPDFTAHLETDTTSWNSGMFKELSTASWFTNSGSPNSSEDKWQSPDVSEEVYFTVTSSSPTNWLPDVSEVYSTAASSVATSWQSPDVSERTYSTTASSSSTNWLPDVSEDTYSTAASSVATWQSPDVSKDMYFTAASSSSTNWRPDVSENTHSTAASSSSTNWLPDVSEVYSTAASSVATSWPSPDVSERTYSTAASSSSTNWRPDVSENTYSTTASSATWPSPNVSEDTYSTAASSSPTNWLPDVSEVYSKSASSVATSWPSPDVSERAYSAALSSSTNWLPDVSEDTYSTASSSVATSWQPDLFGADTTTATNWLYSSSEAAFSTSLPWSLPTILGEFSTTDELPSSSEEYFSTTSSTTNVLPSASEAWSPAPTNWARNLSEKHSTSLDSSSYRDPFTSSPANGTYLKPNVSEAQPFTMTATVGTAPETTGFESSQTASSYSEVGQSISVVRNPLLLQFVILDLLYTDAFSNSSSEAYRELQVVVKGSLNAIFYARYGDRFLGIRILSFTNGSVKVESEVVFQEGTTRPSSSDIVRTVLTHVYHKDLVPTDLEINASSVICNGYSQANLEPVKMQIEFTALSTGFGPWSDEAMFYQGLLQRLSSWVVATLEEKYLVEEFNIGRVIPIQGDVNIQGTALLTTPIHVNYAEALLLLRKLVHKSVDLRSLKVNGSSVNFGVLSVSFLITNRQYNTTLRDSRSAYFCSLGKAVTQALQTILKPQYKNFMQAVLKQFGSGSVTSTSDLVFLNIPPASQEVLDVFFNSVDSRGLLAGTDFTVDAYSFAVGAARLDRPYKRLHFPGFGIAIILLCGLAIIFLPVLAFLCWKYRFCTACQKSFTFEGWDVERENTSVNIPLPEVNRESYRLHETYVNYSFE